MMRKLSWWIVVAGLALPMAAAWAADGKASGAGTAGAESGCCCPICCGHG